MRRMINLVAICAVGWSLTVLRMLRPVGSVLILVGALGIVGCGQNRAGPARPSPVQPAPNPEATKTYLDALLKTMETYSINKDAIDWTSFRTQVVTEGTELDWSDGSWISAETLGAICGR